VTLPLGVLKAKAKTLFEPLLPQKKRDAIRSIGMGTVNKIFLSFK
jgi:monoamine oxidase